MWTMTTVARRTTTCATCRTEHTCTPLVFVLLTDTSHPHWLKSSLSLSPSSTCHPCVVVLDSLRLLLYFHLHFTVLFLSFLSMYSDDLDSVTNNLRDSAMGSNDGYNVAFPLTTSTSTGTPTRASCTTCEHCTWSVQFRSTS